MNARFIAMRAKTLTFTPCWIAAVLAGVAACAQAPSGNPDHGVALRLTNAGSEPMRCSIAFGHWVYRDLGVLIPGATQEVAVIQAARDGALYINRSDGARKMMIENVFCGRTDGTTDGRGQIDLAVARSRRVVAIEAQCAVKADGAVTVCQNSLSVP